MFPFKKIKIDKFQKSCDDKNGKLQQTCSSKFHLNQLQDKSCMENVSAFMPLEEVCICLMLFFFHTLTKDHFESFKIFIKYLVLYFDIYFLIIRKILKESI